MVILLGSGKGWIGVKGDTAEKCETINGDIDDATALSETLEGCDAVIYLIALIREFPKQNLTNEGSNLKDRSE